MSAKSQNRRNRWGFKLVRWLKKQSIKKENNRNFDRWLKNKKDE